MRTKFLNGVYGACPRVLCDRALVLPIGMSEDLSISRVKVNNIVLNNQVFCPKCEDVYVPRIKFVDIDGAYFGSSFPHIFMQVKISFGYNRYQTFPDIITKQKATKYVAKIYGFKIFGKKGSKFEGMKLGDLFEEDKIKEKLEDYKENEDKKV